MSKHTPAPWESVEVKNSGLWSVKSKYRLRDKDKIASQIGKANAKLIAAAPELLEALEQAKMWLEGWASAEPELAIINKAIAKARGENQ